MSLLDRFIEQSTFILILLTFPLALWIDWVLVSRGHRGLGRWIGVVVIILTAKILVTYFQRVICPQAPYICEPAGSRDDFYLAEAFLLVVGFIGLGGNYRKRSNIPRRKPTVRSRSR